MFKKTKNIRGLMSESMIIWFALVFLGIGLGNR